MKKSEWIRYKGGLWIPYRKRTYLYWFKFLQEAERFEDVSVNWRKYKGWGGVNTILGQKFDEWWGDRWKDLFGSAERWTDQTKIKFPLSTTRPKTDAIRMSLLVWKLRDTPPDWRPRYHTGGRDYGTRVIKRRGSNALAIGWKLNQIEKRATYGKWGIKPEDQNQKLYSDDSPLKENLSVKDAGYFGTDHQIQQYVSRWKRRGRKIINNVSEGKFP
jgi:hypothetical protein